MTLDAALFALPRMLFNVGINLAILNNTRVFGIGNWSRLDSKKIVKHQLKQSHKESNEAWHGDCIELSSAKPARIDQEIVMRNNQTHPRDVEFASRLLQAIALGSTKAVQQSATSLARSWKQAFAQHRVNSHGTR